MTVTTTITSLLLTSMTATTTTAIISALLVWLPCMGSDADSVTKTSVQLSSVPLGSSHRLCRSDNPSNSHCYYCAHSLFVPCSNLFPFKASAVANGNISFFLFFCMEHSKGVWFQHRLYPLWNSPVFEACRATWPLMLNATGPCGWSPAVLPEMSPCTAVDISLQPAHLSQNVSTVGLWLSWLSQLLAFFF